MSNNVPYDLKFRDLIDALSQSVIEATDEEIAEEARLDGVDLDANATHMRQLFANAAKQFQKRKFIAAQQAYGKEVLALEQQAYDLPTSADERRALLQAVVAQHAQSDLSFTAKFRDLKTLSDSDIESALQELTALGLISARGSKG